MKEPVVVKPSFITHIKGTKHSVLQDVSLGSLLLNTIQMKHIKDIFGQLKMTHFTNLYFFYFFSSIQWVQKQSNLVSFQSRSNLKFSSKINYIFRSTATWKLYVCSALHFQHFMLIWLICIRDGLSDRKRSCSPVF